MGKSRKETKETMTKMLDDVGMVVIILQKDKKKNWILTDFKFFNDPKD